jgi:hypothetical protein
MIKTHLDIASIDTKTLHKMIFIYNSVEKGWKVKKRKDKYIFQRSHNEKKEYFMDDYLDKFIAENSAM